MKLLTKWLSLLLAGLLLASAFAACDDAQGFDDDDEERSERTTASSAPPSAALTTSTASPASDVDVVTTAPPVTNETPDPTFDHLDENERTINIAYVEGSNGNYTEHSLVVDELNIDVTDNVDLAVQKRNQLVESQLGVILNAVKVSDDIGALEAAVQTGILENQGYWDIIAGDRYFSIGMATKGYLHNLADLDRLDADYIDLEASYWGSAHNDALSYNGAYYWITGDIALRYMGGMYCTFVNSAIYDGKLLATYGNIYDIVKEGRWTLDMLAEMASLCIEEDGDDVRTANDTYGFGYELTDIMDGIAIASNVQFSEKDPVTGAVTLVLDSDHTIDFASKLYKTITGGAASYSYNYGNTNSATVMTKFAEGKVAFAVDKIFQSQAYLSDVENFYLIPAPKYDANQANYATGVYDGVTIFGIPVDCQKVPQTAAALELLALYGEKEVKPAFYEQAMKVRYVGNEDSMSDAAQMIDLIHNSATTDFIVAWSNPLGDISNIFRTESELRRSAFVRSKNDWQKALDDLCEQLFIVADYGTV